ncbi:MAG TPA: aromatic/alkene monooxygenase hydroxylase subunit beta [Acidimicrobiales bacterium]|nr:aromatic/alkene monooxygenase hydroxylase subunit beta [Acidimicrobiales bacterium]
MATAQQKKEEASLPKPAFTNAEAGALEFPSSGSRVYNYYEPRKRRRTVYEDVTVEVQPDPSHYLSQDWLYAFHDGSAGFPASWTALKSSDWHAFRDPNEEWERTIYIHNARVVRQITQNVENAKAAKAFASWDPTWCRVVEQHVGAWAHAEHGLGLHVFLPAQRDAPTNMHNNAISVNSMHKLRFGQDLMLYNLELVDQIDGFDGSAHKQAWQEDPVWQPVRETVERLTAVRDWAEAVFLANFVFEPLIGVLFRSQFVMHLAAPHGDYTTPTVMGAGEADYARDLRYTRDMFALLTNDETYGKENRDILHGWMTEWVPRCVDAARQLQPLWSQPGQRVVRFEDSLDACKQQFEGQINELGLTTPKELQG